MKWIFFDEGKENEPDFEIEADNYIQAYDLAFESYGPQVEGMYYKEKTDIMLTSPSYRTPNPLNDNHGK